MYGPEGGGENYDDMKSLCIKQSINGLKDLTSLFSETDKEKQLNRTIIKKNKAKKHSAKTLV